MLLFETLFKNGPSKICGRQPLKKLKWYGLFKETISILPQCRRSSLNVGKCNVMIFLCQRINATINWNHFDFLYYKKLSFYLQCRNILQELTTKGLFQLCRNSHISWSEKDHYKQNCIKLVKRFCWPSIFVFQLFEINSK